MLYRCPKNSYKDHTATWKKIYDITLGKHPLIQKSLFSGNMLYGINSKYRKAFFLSFSQRCLHGLHGVRVFSACHWSLPSTQIMHRGYTGVGPCFPNQPRARALLSHLLINMSLKGFPGGTMVENLPANAGDTGLSPGLGRSHMPRSN